MKYNKLHGILCDSITIPKTSRELRNVLCGWVKTIVAEPHHFEAAPAPGKFVGAAPVAPAAPAPTLLYTKPTFQNKQKLTKWAGKFFL
jgi:hypothetical protein